VLDADAIDDKTDALIRELDAKEREFARRPPSTGPSSRRYTRQQFSADARTAQRKESVSL